MIAEAFAMVGDDDDERAIESTGLVERADQLRDAAVDVRDLAVVRRGLETRAERRRRVVRCVRVVEMNPGKKRLTARVQPLPRRAGYLAAQALSLQLHPGSELREARVDGIEPLPEAVLRTDDECADERSGAVSTRFEDLSDRGRIGRNRRRRVVSDAEPRRVLSGEDCR